MSMFIGEALAGDGNEVAHIDLLIGDKNGPVGTAFANALADQKQGHSNLLAVLTRISHRRPDRRSQVIAGTAQTRL
jgi:5,6,7,8-tetrahydromethanopterin hydro-lyase